MGLVFTIAWRNIFRHKGKSLIIGVILFLGAFLMTAGNAVITGMNEGLHTHIVEDFCGDVVVASDKQEGDNVFMDPMGKPNEPISNYTAIRAVLELQPSVASFLPVGKNTVMVLNEDGGSPDGVFILGVDFDRYRRVFRDNLTFVKGDFPRGPGVLVPTGGRSNLFMSTGMWFACKGCGIDTVDMPAEAKQNIANIVPREDVVLMGLGDDNTTTDIRLDITGIVRYKALNRILGNFFLMDIESYRRTMGYFAAADIAAVIPEENRNLLGMESPDIDAMFSDAALMANDAAYETAAARPAPAAAMKPQPAAAPAVDIDEGVYNLVLVKLTRGLNPAAEAHRLTAALSAAGTATRAIPWNKAIGPVGSVAVLIKAALFIFVMFLFFVAIIIIVNTLSMAALERTSEIGMMRAVGARKGFISAMFFWETALLSFFFGGLGIACGAIAVKIVSLLRITTTNDMVQLLYGGDRFNPFLTPADYALTVIQLALVTLIAVIYPLTIARKITPLDAIMRD